METTDKEKPKTCLPCGGTGVQTLKDGLRIPCPFCQEATAIEWRS